METKTIVIPENYSIPKYTFGQRTKHGVVVNMSYYPKDSYLAKEFGEGWRYSLMPNKHAEELQYFLEEEMQPLTDAEIHAQIQAELEEHQRQVVILQQQLIAMTSDLTNDQNR